MAAAYIVPVGMMTRILDALRECSEDLRCEIETRYGFPATSGNDILTRRYKRDMETADTADLALAEWAAFRDAPHPPGPEDGK